MDTDSDEVEAPARVSLATMREDGVCEVILRGPGKGNAMGPGFWREMPEVFDELDDDPDVRVVIVRGEGEHFSYGLDLRSMMAELGPHFTGSALARGRTDLLDLIIELQEAFDAVEQCRKPVVAAVHGWCIGGGLDLIAACDVRLCSADARFSLREVKLAMVADLGSLQRLPPIIGQGYTRELAYTGKDIDAERALRIGLVNDVYASPGALLDGARALAREIAQNPPLAVQGIKRVMGYTAEPPVRDGLKYVAGWNAAFLQSNDLQEAMMAFMEKREPTFKGE
jgi:enoyl-CoA hydratase